MNGVTSSFNNGTGSNSFNGVQPAEMSGMNNFMGRRGSGGMDLDQWGGANVKNTSLGWADGLEDTAMDQ
eukprot:963732-Prorocentrum_minimum.AAC.3